MSDTGKPKRFGYLAFRPNGTFDSKVLAQPMDEAIEAEFEELTSVVQSVRPVVFAAQMAQRNLATFDAFERGGANPIAFSTLPAGSLVQSALTYKIDACRHILNFLCAFRAFLDHCDAYVCERHGSGSTQRKLLKAATAAQYDSKFAYRFLYKLRNYAQHFSIPISDTSLTFSMNYMTENYTQSPAMLLLRDDLLRWKDWGPLRSELIGMSDTFDVVPLLQEVGGSVAELCRIVLADRSGELIQCTDYLEKLVAIIKLEPGAIPVVWIGDNAGPGLPPKQMCMIPVDELRLVLRAMGAPV